MRFNTSKTFGRIFAEKGDLLDYILQHGHLEEPHARLWACQLALGVQFLHKLDIAHRDIKCENILITSNNNLKLADFGFARFLSDSSGQYRYSRTFCGSLAYAAPEVLKADKYDGKCSDIWSYGIVVFIMLNQVMPFRELSVDAMYKKQTTRQWKFRSIIANNISTEVIQFVNKLLDPDPEQRHTIDDAIKDQWFIPLMPFITDKITRTEKFAEKNKQNLLPDSVRLDLPTWDRKHKDIVRLTDLSFEEEPSETMMNVLNKQPSGKDQEDSSQSSANTENQSVGSYSKDSSGVEDLPERTETIQQQLALKDTGKGNSRSIEDSN